MYKAKRQIQVEPIKDDSKAKILFIDNESQGKRRKEDGIKLIMSAEVFQQSGHQLTALPAARAQAATARPAPTRLQLVIL